MERDEYNESLLAYVGATVERFKRDTAVKRFQIENESFFPFGECPKVDPVLVQAEIDLARSLTDKPIQQTTSGEQAVWMNRAIPADILGVSLYRRVSDKKGEWLFPHTPGVYDVQRRLALLFSDQIIISELQAEPWGLGEYVYPTPEDLDQAYEKFDVEEFTDNLDFARRTGVDEVYLWGLEWWYFLKMHDETRLWDGIEDELINYFE